MDAMSEEEMKWYEDMDILMDSKGEKPNALYGMKKRLESIGYSVSDVYRASEHFAAITVLPLSV
jgi:hypothetical protein